MAKTPDLTTDQMIFAEWLATPRKVRSPKTYGGLAAQIGVARKTLYEWKKIPGLVDFAASRAKARVGKYLPDVLQSIVDSATGGSVQAQKLFMELHDDVFHKQKVEVENKGAELTQMTDEELIERLASKLKRGVHADAMPDAEELIGILKRPASPSAAEKTVGRQKAGS